MKAQNPPDSDRLPHAKPFGFTASTGFQRTREGAGGHLKGFGHGELF